MIRDCQCKRARHTHGTADGYTKDGCRCTPCTAAAMAYNAHRKRQIAYGRWDRWTDATGTVRRLNALTADGWSAQALGDALGMSKAATVALRRAAATQGRVLRATAERIAYAYDRLHDVPPPGRYQERCERYAARMGWAASWRWEGLDMDDPAAVPLPLPDDGELDEVAVERIMAGRLAATPGRERVEAIRRLAARGLSDRVIAARIGSTVFTVCKERERRGVAAGVPSNRRKGAAA